MLDPLSLAVGAGLLGAGFLGGRFRRPRARPPTPQPETCACGHALAYHDRQTGACAKRVKQESDWDAYGGPVEYEYVECACRRYVGPLPVEDVLGYGPNLARHLEGNAP